jgi:anti-anti-sigma factor
VGDVVVLALRGIFYGERETDEFQKAILDETAAGNLHLVVSLAECQGLNSVAIGALMRGFTNYRGRGGEIKLAALGPRLKDLFTMTKIIKVFDHHETEEEAIAAFAVGAK